MRTLIDNYLIRQPGASALGSFGLEVRKIPKCPDYRTLGDLRGVVVCNNGQCGVGKTYRFHQWLKHQDEHEDGR